MQKLLYEDGKIKIENGLPYSEAYSIGIQIQEQSKSRYIPFLIKQEKLEQYKGISEEFLERKLENSQIGRTILFNLDLEKIEISSLKKAIDFVCELKQR